MQAVIKAKGCHTKYYFIAFVIMYKNYLVVSVCYLFCKLAFNLCFLFVMAVV